MGAQQVSNHFKIELDGKPLPDDAEVAIAVVEDHLHLPDSVSLTMKDSDRQLTQVLKLKIGSKIKISLVSDAAKAPVTLFEGEVTALEFSYHAGVSYTVIRGYDGSHRLNRGHNTHSYLNMTYSDVAKKVASANQIEVGKIDPSSPTHPHITQANESDWAFLSRMAAEIGFEVTVRDQKLTFAKPIVSDTAPNDRDLTSDDPLVLMPGSNLLSIRTSVTAAEQVKEVEVRGWDRAKKAVVKATAPAKTAITSNGSSSAAVAKVFPSPPLVSAGLMLADDRDAEHAAKALAEVVAASHTEIEGQARGNPKLKAGAAIRLAQTGEPFDGKYVVTSTRHHYDAEEGYVTSFTVSGRQERSTLSLTGWPSGPSGSMRGVVPAIVDDVDDPDKLCRVRLNFPWMGDKFVTDWCQVVQAGAGNKRGFVVQPEVDDEVLVAFEFGDVRRPYVLGGVYNAIDKPETGPGPLIDSTSKKVNNRLYTSRRGHQLLFVDSDEGAAVVVQSSNKKLVIRLDEKDDKIVIESGGDLEIGADGDIKIKAKGEVNISGRSIKSEAQSTWSAKGSTASLEGSGPVTVKGQPIQLN